MTERTITEQVIKHLRANLPGAVILKHSDRATSGIPDFSVSIHGETFWIEMKYLRPGQKYRGIIKAHQLFLCRNLARVCHGKCWIVVFEELPRAIPRSPKHKQVTIWEPAKFLRGSPSHVVKGWPYDVVANLIQGIFA